MLLYSLFKDKRVLITGNTGFKGAWLSLILHRLGAAVTGISHHSVPSESLYTACQLDEITEQLDFDILDKDRLFRTIRAVRPDFIFHLAAQSITLRAYQNPLETFQLNGLGTANLLECLRKSDRACIGILVTSDKCYRNNEWIWGYRENDVLAGIDPYSASKSVAEIIAHSYHKSFFQKDGKIRIATCRAGNVIGGGDWNTDRIIPDCIRAWRQGQPIAIRSPKAIRPWNYVLDVLTGYLKAALNLYDGRISGESFNFGPQPESEISVLDLVERLWSYWPGADHDPYRLDEDRNKPFEHTYLRLNSEKAFTLLDWKSDTSINQALAETAGWYRAWLEDPLQIRQHSIQLIDAYLNNRS